MGAFQYFVGGFRTVDSRCPKHVEWILCLREQFVPQLKREIAVGGAKSGDEVIFEGLDRPFCGINTVLICDLWCVSSTTKSCSVNVKSPIPWFTWAFFKLSVTDIFSIESPNWKSRNSPVNSSPWPLFFEKNILRMHTEVSKHKLLTMLHLFSYGCFGLGNTTYVKKKNIPNWGTMG